MKSDTLNSFGTIIFLEPNKFSATNIRSIRLFLSTALDLFFRATHLSWFMGHIDLSLEGPSVVVSMVT